MFIAGLVYDLGLRIVVGYQLVLVAACTLVACALLFAPEVQRRWGSPAALLFLQSAWGLAVLGVSYRLLSLVALGLLVAWHLMTSRAHHSWLIWLGIVASCFLPIDVSLQNFHGHPRAAETAPCSTGRAYEAMASNTSEFVCVNWGERLYNSPERVWVW